MSQDDLFNVDNETFRFTLTLGFEVGHQLNQVSLYTGISPSAVVTYLLSQTDLEEICAGITEMQQEGRYLPTAARKRYTKTAQADADRVLALIPRVGARKRSRGDK
jgi:hypothetical protein